MTDKEIEKLANLIVEKLTKMQEEYDAKVMEAIKEQSQSVSVTYFTNTLTEDYKMSKEEEIESLKKELQEALDAEDYFKASKINEKINKLQS